MGFWQHFKQEFMVAFRLGLQRDPHASEKLRQRRQDEREAERFANLLRNARTDTERAEILRSATPDQRAAAKWVSALANAKSDAERQQAAREAIDYILGGDEKR